MNEIKQDNAKEIAKKIRECYEKHDKSNICCECGEKDGGNYKCSICNTNTYCSSCKDFTYVSGYPRLGCCSSEFDECPICGYSTKKFGSKVTYFLEEDCIYQGEHFVPALERLKEKDGIKNAIFMSKHGLNDLHMDVLKRYDIVPIIKEPLY